MIRASDIRARDWQPALGRPGEVVTGIGDIEQCIRIILGTPKGADPHRPTFGSDLWRYVDHPIGEAIPYVVREAVDAIRIWEPRVELLRVMPTVDPAAPGRLNLTVEWALKGAPGDREPLVTEVPLGG